MFFFFTFVLNDYLIRDENQKTHQVCFILSFRENQFGISRSP